jgi:hypothetical protein
VAARGRAGSRFSPARRGRRLLPLLPYALSRWGLASINRREGQPFIFYLHPWEIDPHQPRVSARWLSRFRHYTNLDKCEARLRRLLGEFRFGPARESLAQLGLLTS